MGGIDEKGLNIAEKKLKSIRQTWHEIESDSKLYTLAEELPKAHGLRALDSFQLAAALVWCKEKPKGRVFVCDDTHLCEAAESLGFTVVP
jgi:hypothetical protein